MVTETKIELSQGTDALKRFPECTGVLHKVIAVLQAVMQRLNLYSKICRNFNKTIKKNKKTHSMRSKHFAIQKNKNIYKVKCLELFTK